MRQAAHHGGADLLGGRLVAPLIAARHQGEDGAAVPAPKALEKQWRTQGRKAAPDVAMAPYFS